MNMDMNPDTQPTQSPPEVMPPAPPSTDLPEHATEASGDDTGFSADSPDDNDAEDALVTEGPGIPEAENEPKREAPTTSTHNTSKHM